MNLSIVTEPAIEPVSLVDIKNFCKVDADTTDDDVLLMILVGAARRYAESYTGRAFITQTWQATLDSFPLRVPPLSVLTPSPMPRYTGADIGILMGNIQTVNSVTYLDLTGQWQTLDPTTYVADCTGLVTRLAPAAGKAWPQTLDQIASVKIAFTAGYGGDAAHVPEVIRHWIMIRTNTLYMNREEVAILSRGKVDPLPFVDSLLDLHKVPAI
jgi:uncharacterized phiE125 gp8 family phage protein